MGFLAELLMTVAGGVLTALILSIFARRGARDAPLHPRQHAAAVEPARRRSAFGNFLQLVLAVCGGVAIAMLGGRALFQSGVLERSLTTRLGLLVAGTVVIWYLLSALRPR